MMQIVNRTQLPAALLRALLEFAAGDIEHERVWVEVWDGHWDVDASFSRPPRPSRRAGKAGAEALLEIAYTSDLSHFPHQSLPERNGGSGAPLLVTNDPEELLVACAAHEFRHLAQNREDEAAGWTLWSRQGKRLGAAGEADAEQHAAQALAAFRARRSGF